MTLEQRRALALAGARLRLQERPEQAQPDQPSEADLLAGSPAVRFALGAASPVLGAAQLASEAMGDDAGISPHLKRLEGMKQRGMTPAAEVMRLKAARDQLASLKGYEAVIADLDRKIAEAGPSPSADPRASGTDVAGIAGAVVSPVALGAMKIPMAASVLGRAGQGAAIGAGFGAAAPVTDTDDFLSAKSAQVGAGLLLGGLIPPAIDAGRKVYQVGRNIIDPMLPGGAKRGAARLIAEAAGSKRPQIEAELAADRVLVPGSQPTAAEAAAPAGSAEFSGLQGVMAQRSPTTYSDIAKGQESARAAAIGRVAKTPAELNAAMEVRAASAAQNYGDAAKDLIVPGASVKTLFERPSMKAAIDEARTLVQERGLPFGSIDDGFTVENLQAVKMALDDMIKNPERFGIGASKADAISKTRMEFMQWLGKESPKWDRARAVYANQSRPINEMQVGRELEKSLTKPMGDGERATVFASAVREAPRTMKRATGQPRFEELDEVLSSKSLKEVKGVLEDLARKAEQDRLSRLGVGKAREITTAFQLPATGPLQQQYMIFKTILGRISKGVNEKTLDEISDAMQTPKGALKLLQMAPDNKKQAVINNIIERRLGRGAIIAGSMAASEGSQQ